jgi:ParB-like chromosome segregation protein Spo0J
MDRREYHPVADLFPLLRGEAFQELVADIARNGLLEPILVDAQGRILDGRNRYRACLRAGVEPRFVEWQGQGSQAELALSRNLHRRHLDESQRALVAARLSRLLEAEAAERKAIKSQQVANLPPAEFGKTREKAARLVNVSPRLAGHATKVLKNGCDELIRAVESGGLAVSAASVLAGLPKEEQAKVVAAGAKSAAAKARELGRATGRPRAPRPSPGCYGVMRQEPPSPHGLASLWVDDRALDEARKALEAWGFRYSRPQGPQHDRKTHDVVQRLLEIDPALRSEAEQLLR